MMIDFAPPANDFYNRAARLSIWSKSDVDDFILDANKNDSASDESADVSIKRLSDNESFTGS